MKRSGYIERRKPIEAKRWGIKPKRPRRMDRKDRERMVNDFDGTGPRIELVPGANPDRLAWVRLEPCVVCGREASAEAPNQACHEGGTGRGLALKCPDEETFSMCADCHLFQWTIHRGFCKGWTREQRATFALEHHAAAHAKYLSHGSRRAA